MKEKFISSYLCQLLVRYVKEKRDNEFEQALVRVLIGLVLIYYFNDLQFSQAQAVAANALNLVFVPSLFVIAAVSMAACVYFWPGEMPIRRILSILLDIASLTYLLLVGGSHAAPLCFLYQWIVIGYGFRFGRAILAGRSGPCCWPVVRYLTDIHVFKHIDWSSIQGARACRGGKYCQKAVYLLGES